MSRRFSHTAVLVLAMVFVVGTARAQHQVSAKQVVTFGIHRSFAKAITFQNSNLHAITSPSLFVQTSTITSTKVTAGFGADPASTVPARDCSALSSLQTASYEPELWQERAFPAAGNKLRDSRRSSFVFTVTE